MAKGYVEYKKFSEKKKLTRKEAMLAQCFVCNSLGEDADDCHGEDCPLYPWMPYNPNRRKGVAPKLTEEGKKRRAEGLERARKVKGGSKPDNLPLLDCSNNS